MLFMADDIVSLHCEWCGNRLVAQITDCKAFNDFVSLKAKHIVLLMSVVADYQTTTAECDHYCLHHQSFASCTYNSIEDNACYIGLGY